MSGAANRLRLLSRAAGYRTVTEFAVAAGVKAGTSRQHVQRDSIPKDAGQQYIKKAQKTGASLEWLLHGVGRAPDDLPDGDKALARAVAQVSNDNVQIYQLDIHARAGIGADGEFSIMDHEYADQIVGTYSFPAASFRQIFGAEPNAIVMAEVKGDSMIPTLYPGQIVMINTDDKMPSPPGLFYVWDGLGVVIKRIEFVQGSKPPTVRISSDNTRYSTYERTIGEAYILGRIVTGFQRFG